MPALLRVNETLARDELKRAQHAYIVNSTAAHGEQKLHPFFGKRIVHLHSSVDRLVPDSGQTGNFTEASIVTLPDIRPLPAWQRQRRGQSAAYR
jgi:hypothetical protein